LSSYAAWDEDENAMDLFWDKVKDHLKKVYWFPNKNDVWFVFTPSCL
jgi:hypothetical protein